MSSSAPSVQGVLRICVLAFVGTLSISAVADDAPKPSDDGARRRQDEAMRLFGEGRAKYDSGRYDEAIAAFTRAYALAPDPLLVFNIAQAHRRAGNCAAAVAAYEDYLRLDPGSTRTEEARSHARALSIQCPPSLPRPAVAAGVSRSGSVPASTRTADEGRPGEHGSLLMQRPPSWRSRARILGLGAGMLLGVGAAGLRWWNDGRFEEWRRTDQMLATEAAAGSSLSAAALIAGQDRNDQYLRSIRGVDSSVLAVGIVAGICVATSLVLLLLDR
jgi:tetratricopeptide (TPR) repeat protein